MIIAAEYAMGNAVEIAIIAKTRKKRPKTENAAIAVLISADVAR